MAHLARFSALLVAASAWPFLAWSNETGSGSEASESAVAPSKAASASESQSAASGEETAPQARVSAGTKSFDAASIEDLYQEYKLKNEKLAKESAPHLSDDDRLDLVVLKAVNVEANSSQDYQKLLERIDPQPRRRLEIMKEFDPVAARDMQVALRSEERFFSGEDAFKTGAGVGSVGGFSVGQLGEVFSSLFGMSKKDKTAESAESEAR